MKTINNETLVTIENANAGKLARSVIANARANMFKAGLQAIEVPDGLSQFVKLDGTTVPFNTEMLVLRYISLAACGLDGAVENLPYGLLSKGFEVSPDMAALVQAETTKAKSKPHNTPVTAKEQLLIDIKTAFMTQIADLNATLQTVLASHDLHDSYYTLANETEHKNIFVGCVEVDITNTRQLIAKEAVSEQLEQITSIFSGTATEYNVELSPDCKTAEVQLNSWDKNNATIILERLQSFGLAGKFSDDKNGILAKLQCQLLTVTLK